MIWVSRSWHRSNTNSCRMYSVPIRVRTCACLWDSKMKKPGQRWKFVPSWKLVMIFGAICQFMPISNKNCTDMRVKLVRKKSQNPCIIKSLRLSLNRISTFHLGFEWRDFITKKHSDLRPLGFYAMVSWSRHPTQDTASYVLSNLYLEQLVLLLLARHSRARKYFHFVSILLTSAWWDGA